MSAHVPHVEVRRSFRGMRLRRVTDESVVYGCDECGEEFEAPRCVAETARGEHCPNPVGRVYGRCRVHRGRAAR